MGGRTSSRRRFGLTCSSGRRRSGVGCTVSKKADVSSVAGRPTSSPTSSERGRTSTTTLRWRIASKRARMCLEFPTQILNPDKPHWLTVKLANTLLGTWTKKRDVNWWIIVQDLAHKLVAEIGKTLPTPICLSSTICTGMRSCLRMQRRKNASLPLCMMKPESASQEILSRGVSGEGDVEEMEESGDKDGPEPAPFQLVVVVLASGTVKVHIKPTQENRRGPAPNRGKGSGKEKEKTSIRPKSGKQTANPKVGCDQYLDPMVNLVFEVGKAREEYYFMHGVVPELS